MLFFKEIQHNASMALFRLKVHTSWTSIDSHLHDDIFLTLKVDTSWTSLDSCKLWLGSIKKFVRA
jgi:hypothetical protein